MSAAAPRESSSRRRTGVASLPRDRLRVATLSWRELEEATVTLISMMAADGFEPQALIGIESGGGHMVRAVSHLGTPTYTCTFRRPGTETKRKLASLESLVRVLPYSVTDRLRAREDRRDQRNTTDVSASQVAPGALARQIEGVVSEIEAAQWRRIALIDDAVDSGRTLRVVRDELLCRLPARSELRTAVVTRTRAAGITAAQPDYALFNGVLCRFPWSFDYRGADRAR